MTMSREIFHRGVRSSGYLAEKKGSETSTAPSETCVFKVSTLGVIYMTELYMMAKLKTVRKG